MRVLRGFHHLRAVLLTRAMLIDTRKLDYYIDTSHADKHSNETASLTGAIFTATQTRLHS